MLMALVSLTWEIKGQSDCANKQVLLGYLCVNLITGTSNIYKLCAERSRTIFGMGYNARFCNAPTKSIPAPEIVYSHCFRKGNISCSWYTNISCMMDFRNLL